MFLRIAGVVGSVLLLVYIADDYIPASTSSRTAETVSKEAVGLKPVEQVQTEEVIAEVAPTPRPSERLLPLGPTLPFELPTDLASNSSSRSELLPPIPLPVVAEQQGDASVDSVVDSPSTSEIASADEIEPDDPVRTASLGTSAIDGVPFNQAFASRAVPPVPEQLTVNLMVVRVPTAAVHAEPKRNSGVMAVLNSGFVVNAVRVSGTDWMFVQDPQYSLSGYMRRSQLNALYLTQ